ncbi:MAG: TRAP transporter substrate-binding protein [Deferrisomatales bacterium]|nr:TRAP transporter substrate-binding protein [Deferrisomatales bacterium]
MRTQHQYLRPLIVLVALCVAWGGLWAPRAEAKITLTYAFFAPAKSFPGVQMEHWAKELEKRTGGEVEVKLFPGGTLLGPRDMYDGVLNGVADIGLSCPSYDPGRFPLSSGVSLPVGFPSSKVASLTYWDLMNELKPAEFSKFKVITMFTTEPGYIQSKKPVRSLADLKGMKLRAAGTGVPVLQALGAAPVGMPMPQVPESIQTGVIEGTMTSREVLRDFKLAEMLGNVLDYPTVVVTFAAVMDQKKWDALPAKVKKAMDELSREMAVWTGDYHDNANVGEALKWAKKEHGLQVTELNPGEKEKWDALIHPMVGAWTEEMTAKGYDAKGFLDRLYALRDKNMKAN